MATFVTTFKFTPQGMANIQETAKRAAAFKRHILTSKETKSKRQKRGTEVVADQDAARLRLMLPYK